MVRVPSPTDPSHVLRVTSRALINAANFQHLLLFGKNTWARTELSHVRNNAALGRRVLKIYALSYSDFIV